MARAPDLHSGGRGFEPHRVPQQVYNLDALTSGKESNRGESEQAGWVVPDKRELGTRKHIASWRKLVIPLGS